MTISSQICLCVGVCINTLLSKILIYKNFQEKEILMVNVFSLLAKDDHYILYNSANIPRWAWGAFPLYTGILCASSTHILCVVCLQFIGQFPYFDLSACLENLSAMRENPCSV